MAWNDIIVDSLKKWDTSLVAYVPDISIDRVTTLIDDDPYFHLVSATREEEAIGVAVGAYATGRNSAVFMQSSGFGNSINAIASLCIPARTPIPIFLNLAGRPRRVQHCPGAHGAGHPSHTGHLRPGAFHPGRRVQHGENS